MQKPRDRRLAHSNPVLRQSNPKLFQRDIRLIRYQLPNQILVPRQRKILVAAKLGRADAARFPVKPEKADNRSDADPTLLPSLRDRRPTLNRIDHMYT